MNTTTRDGMIYDFISDPKKKRAAMVTALQECQKQAEIALNQFNRLQAGKWMARIVQVKHEMAAFDEAAASTKPLTDMIESVVALIQAREFEAALPVAQKLTSLLNARQAEKLGAVL